MSEEDAAKYGELRLVKGGRYARQSMRVRTAKELELDDRMRAAYQRCRSARGTVPSIAIQRIIEGEQKPWRIPARRVLEMRAAGVPLADVKRAAVGEMEEWIDDVFADATQRAA